MKKQDLKKIVAEVISALPKTATSETLTKGVEAMLKEHQIKAEEKHAMHLFEQNLNNIVHETPGFGDYISETDDFNRVRVDYLKGLKDVEERDKALTHLHETFVKAVSAGGGSAGSHTAMKPKEEEPDEFDGLLDKFDNGNFDKNPKAFESAFFTSLNNELNEYA